ncbi:MAG: response regulator transcription factor [Anaerolineaceae bacterium]|nr:response regulator transcription factor [Anaerolineaceae bacterium]
MTKTRILIVDDHPLLREALCAAIQAEPDMQVVGEASNGQQAVQEAMALKPDAVVMDLYLPVKDGVTAIKEIIAATPSARILAITSSTEDRQVVSAIQAGALGYLTKDASRAQFLQGLRQVASGKIFLPPEIAEKLARGVRQRPLQEEYPQPEPLTHREQEVMYLLGEGLSNRMIARKLQLSEATVRVHVFNILQKLGLTERGQAIVYAMRLRQEGSKNY